MSGWAAERYESKLMAGSDHIFNPQAVYKTPPGGLIAKDLLYQDGEMWKHTGALRLPAGCVIIWDADFVGGNELDTGEEK